MRELLMSKIITDFKFKFHLSQGVASSASARELTHDLLPFLMELHASLPNRLTRALYQLISKVSSQLPPQIHSLASDGKKNDRLLSGFVMMH